MNCIFILLLISAQRPGACFLLIPPTAKATGMAYAWTAIADDASANYYNAAGLAFLDKLSVTATYFKYIPGFHREMPYLYLGAGRSFNQHGIGGDIICFIPGIVQVINPQGELIRTETAYRFAVRLNYARNFLKCLSLGLGGSVVHEYLFPDWVIEKMPELGIEAGGTGTSFGLNLNMLYRIKPYLSIGLVVNNIGPDISYAQSGSSDPLPMLCRLGLAYKSVEFNNLSATLSTEMIKVLVGMFANTENSFWENVNYEFKEAWKAIGLEVKYFKMLSLRTGYFYDYEGQRIGWTYGGGIKVLNLEIDFGIDEDVFDFRTQNRKLSLTYTF